MKAMIMAAGRGTRLRPITDRIPKALVSVGEQPMLEITIKKLMSAGVDEIIVNVHHFADQIIRFLEQNNHFGIRLEVSDERENLLDTGGGLKKARWFFDDQKPFFVHNVDILSGASLTDLYKAHAQYGGIATLLVRHRPGNRLLLFDENHRLCGWTNRQTGERIMCCQPPRRCNSIAFSSIHVVDPTIFDAIERDGVFSLRDVYLDIAADHPIYAHIDDEQPWIDIGTPEALQKAADVFHAIQHKNRT